MSIEWVINGFGKIIEADCSELSSEIETIKIPSEIKGQTVTTLREYLFAGNLAIKTVIIPSSVNNIEASVFEGCKNLQTVQFEENSQLEIIGESAFRDCDIRNFPFKELKNLHKLDKEAFAKNKYLGIVDLSDSTIESLNDGCFNNSGVTEIYFPQNLYFFGKHCLENTNLNRLDFSNIKAFPIIVNDEAFKSNKHLHSVNFSNNFISLGQQCFSKCSSLKEITIPSTVNLADYCFSYAGLKTVVLEKGNPSIEALPTGVFFQCYMLEDVKIDTNFTIIEDFAFAECKSLQTISFPKTLNRIDKSVFWQCPNLKEIDLTQTNIQSIGSCSFAWTRLGLACFKMDYLSATEIDYDTFYRNPNISNEEIIKKYPFCYVLPKD